jgi:hypothetical protein
MAAELFTSRRQPARSDGRLCDRRCRGQRVGQRQRRQMASQGPSPSRADHRRTRRPCHPRAISSGHHRYVADSHGHSAWTVHQDRPLLTWRSGAARNCMACRWSGVQIPLPAPVAASLSLTAFFSNRPVSIGLVAPSPTLGWEASGWFWTVVLPPIWWRPGGTDGEAPAGDSATPGVPGLSALTDLHVDARIWRQAVGLEEVLAEDLQEIGSVSLTSSVLVVVPTPHALGEPVQRLHRLLEFTTIEASPFSVGLI